MKILCISDQIDPIVYSTRMRERFQDVDVVISAGDLPMEYLSFIVSCLNKPLLFVFGNHNLTDLPFYRPRYAARFGLKPPRSGLAAEEHASGATYLGFRHVNESGLLFAGFGGSMRYNGGPNQYSNFQMMTRIALLVPRFLLNKLLHGRYVDIIVTHAPPQGIHDRDDQCHRGFKAFLWLMKAFKPRYLIHGHVHLYDLNDVRVSEFGITTVVNAFSHHIIEYEENHG